MKRGNLGPDRLNFGWELHWLHCRTSPPCALRNPPPPFPPPGHVDSYMHERSPASKRGSWQELEYHACHDQEPLHQCRRSMIYFTGFVGASCMHMPNAKFTVNGVILQYNVDNVLMKITFQTGSQLREMRWQRAVGFLYIYVKKNSIARKGE